MGQEARVRTKHGTTDLFQIGKGVQQGYIWSPCLFNLHAQYMVKQEMARVNVNILRISELKCTEMGKFNSDDHYIYCCGQEFSIYWI